MCVLICYGQTLISMWMNETADPFFASTVLLHSGGCDLSSSCGTLRLLLRRSPRHSGVTAILLRAPDLIRVRSGYRREVLCVTTTAVLMKTRTVRTEPSPINVPKE